MRIAIHGVDVHGVKLYARWLKWSDASFSMLYMESCFILIPIHRVKLYLNAIQRRKLNAHCYTWIEALRSLLYMNRSFMLIFIHGVTLYPHYYTWREALCSLLRME